MGADLIVLTVSLGAGKFPYTTHLGMDLVFLVIGCLFAWTVVGADPTPEPAPALIRLGLLLVAMPFDVVVVLRRRPGAPDRDYEALTEMLDSQLQSQQRQKGLPAGSA